MINRDGLVNSNDWMTPNYVYDILDDEFNFDFDPCPYKSNFNGLEVEWGNSNFVNPPYDRINKPKFIKKAYEEWLKGKTCVLLIPASTDTKEFHKTIFGNAEIRFVEGRVSFEGYNTKGEWSTKNKGKHASMICIFRAGVKSKKVTTTKFNKK